MAIQSKILAVIALVLLRTVGVCSTQTTDLEGTVRDSQNALVADARVSVASGSYQVSGKTDAAGHFSFTNIPGTSGTLSVVHEGFAAANQPWTANGARASVEVILQPLSAHEAVTVSATRTEVRLAETPGSTVLLSNTDVSSTPALRVDDVLRQVPGFSLFRRSDSRVANASNQGVSLRGLGGTAASRALVLEDGLPIVDAFGGWVYWDRVPRRAISDVEVFRGGASNLYGSDALGGVVQFITRQPEYPTFSLDTSYGNERTGDLSAWGGTRAGKWDVSVGSEMFRTDGFILVPTWQRGTIDTPANSEDASVELTVGRQVGAKGRVFGRGDFYTEFRQNGTPLQTNDTRLGQGALGFDDQFGSHDWLMLRTYGVVQSYNQSFSSVAADRNSESLTDLQYIPEQVGGGGIQWTHFLGKYQTWIAGGDLMEVMGSSRERLFT